MISKLGSEIQTEKYLFFYDKVIFQSKNRGAFTCTTDISHNDSQPEYDLKYRLCLSITDSLGSLSCCQQAQEKVLWLLVLAAPSVDGRTETSFNSNEVKGDLCSVF